MTTVASRKFNSTPQRDAAATWRAVVEVLTQGVADAKKDELLAVTGVASSLIADKAPESAPIVVTCDGPRTRIYCLYDEDATDGSDANEESLGFEPLKGDWRISLPCEADDLSWVQNALKKHSERITARDKTSTTSTTEGATNSAELELDPKGFAGS